MTSPLIEVHPDAAAVATAVAGELISRIADAQAGGHAPHICLTGGTIAGRIHEEVARLAPDASPAVDWSAVHFWFGDERYVEADDPDRNAGQARAAFLDVLLVPDAHIHEVPTPSAACAVEEAARGYAAMIDRALPADGFTVMMLGIGPDGHIASLFPGFAQLAVDDVSAVAVEGSPKPPPQRISMTYPTLTNARSVWFVAEGEGKAEAIARALADEGSVDETPARGASGRDETVWFLDTAAASRL